MAMVPSNEWAYDTTLDCINPITITPLRQYEQMLTQQRSSSYDERYFPETAEQQEIINQMAGGPSVLYRDHMRDGIWAESFEKGRVFIPFYELRWVEMELREKREHETRQTARSLYGTKIDKPEDLYPPIPSRKKNYPMCTSCKKEHNVTPLDSFGRCPDRMLKLWDNVHKLYWHRYSKNKTK